KRGVIDMRKMVLALASAATLAAVSAPASAAVSITYTPGSNTLGDNQVVLEDFGTTAAAVGTNSNIYTSSVASHGTRPTGSTGGFLAVGSTGSGSYTYTLATAAPVLSFLLGTLDSYNSVLLTFVNGTTLSLTGLAITGGSGTVGSGFVDGRVTYDVQSSDISNFISSITFSSTRAAMEIDDIASAAPEPGTWLMMILGFGLAGAGLRSRRRQGKLALS
ncbi:MAG: PEPxxWA-CTERM sorting domain-containing protein, partial [Novosphingobium sp.]